MGPGIVQRMGNFIYRVFSFRGSITVCGTVSAAGKCILCIGSHQLLCGVGNLEDHFIVFGEKEIVTVKWWCFSENEIVD